MRIRRPAVSAGLPDFPWDTLDEARKVAGAHPGGIVDLSVGTPVDPVAPVIREALAGASASSGYPTTAGTPALRESIVAALSRRYGVTGLSEAAVLPVIGTKELIAWLPTLLGLGPPDVVAVPELAYPTYDVGARLARAQVVRADSLTQLGPRSPALLYLNSPSNPTGRVLGVEHLRKVVAWARERGAVVASDECYLGLAWEAEPYSVLHPSVCDGDHTGLLALHSLSKTSSMAGYRAGFVAGDRGLVAELLAVRKHAGMMVPTPVQAAMVAALDDDAHECEQRYRYAQRREALLDVDPLGRLHRRSFAGRSVPVGFSSRAVPRHRELVRSARHPDRPWRVLRARRCPARPDRAHRDGRADRRRGPAAGGLSNLTGASRYRRGMVRPDPPDDLGHPDYDLEAVDRLPFATPEKSQRYRTDNYRGAVGLNWYRADPSLQFVMAYYLNPAELAFAEPHLTRIGELMGGPVARWAEETDRNPARLERYDRWGHDVSRVIQPPSFLASKAAVLDAQRDLREDARRVGVNPSLPLFAANYLLNQADIGMGCALGTGGNMVKSLVAAYAPPDVRDHILAKFASGEWEGETAQLLTERTGGSDLGSLETTARRGSGDAWLVNGLKWFASNCDGKVFIVLAKPDDAPDSSRGVATFLVLRTRRDGSRNGIRIRRLKDKLGTRSVASGEVEFVDAEAFLLSGEPSSQEAQAGPSDGKGLGRMMELTNAARLGIALFALGNARRALVESLCYTRQRRAFGDRLIDKPLMRRKLAEMIVDVEAAQALVFDSVGFANHQQPTTVRQRIAVPVTKLKVCRMGIAMASDAIEIHGGNGYIETWPVAKLLRDAQVNTIWEGPDNILCLDVRRGIERSRAHEPLLARMRDAVSVSDDDDTTQLVRRRIDDLDAAITAWSKLREDVAEARLFPLAHYLGDVYAGALLAEQAAWERATRGADRKNCVARLYAQRFLADRGPLRDIDHESDEAIERFDELVDGALMMD